MTSKKIQLYTDRANTIEASPETSANCVILSDGNDLQKVLDNDLTNPTVVHEETSFKVGAGDIDVSSSVVDGEVGHMVIKGKTYQNILPEPSTPVLTNNKEMFKVNEGLDANVEIVDAVSKSAILKGQTLVNLINDGEVTKNATNNWVVFSADFNADMIKTSTDYTLITYVISNTLSDGSGCDFGVSGGLNDGFGFKAIRVPSGKVGVYKIKLTTKNVFSQPPVLRQQIFNDVATGSITFKQVLVEGDYTNVDIPYFEGMQSVKLPVLTTTGKNLFRGLYSDFNQDGWGSFKYGNIGEYYTVSIYDKDANVSLDGISFGISVKGDEYNTLNWITNGNTVYINSLTTNNKNSFTIQPNNEETLNKILQRFNIQIEQGSTATSYEPYKSNILSTSENVVLRGIGEVRDELDLMTGELVQSVGEIILDGSDDEEWRLNWGESENYIGFQLTTNIPNVKGYSVNQVSNLLPHTDYNSLSAKDYEWFVVSHLNTVNLKIAKNKLISSNVDGLKRYLSINPLITQYQLAEKSIKTVDLSTSGNWEKVVFNGSEGWSKFNIADLTTTSQFYLQLPNFKNGVIICNEFPYYPSRIVQNGVEGVSGSGGNGLNIWLNVLNSKIGGNTVEKFKQYLSQNPLTVWYQTTTHQDSTQVKQPIFFKDGHIQLSSGVDNSLIPTLDYQAKTSNSYVMDLMKTNTKYTMKAKSASGTFTIDGTSYGAGTNGTFTTPTSMTNKLLVMSNKTNEEVMILEGDVVSKSIPYFKGIKSAFEDEGKIEVLSTDSNLLINNQRLQEEGVLYFTKGWSAVRLTTKAKKVKIVVKNKTGITGTKLNVKDDIESESNFIQLFAVNEVFTTIEREYSLKNSNVISFCSYGSLTFSNGTFFDNYDIEVYTLDNMDETLVVEKSNNTKIPLLSPLRSLPNGVCDELIIDRMKKKATLIQRIKSTVFNGSEGWNLNGYSHDKLVEFVCHGGAQMAHAVFSDRFATGGENVERVAFSGGSIYIRILKTKVSNVDSFKKWLSQNPLTVQCGLQTPLVTEIDLESFPLVYKDGHIFLSSEIAPVVEIDYNVNQSQQIQANNETLQRHELDILDLDNLIVSFVDCEYRLRLLKFNMELSMMALAE